MERFDSFYWLSLFEALIGIPYGFVVWFVCIFPYLCGGLTGRKGGGYFEDLPANRPYFFIFGPRQAAGFSSLVFLSFASPRLLAAVSGGVFRMWLHMIWASSWCVSKKVKKGGAFQKVIHKLIAFRVSQTHSKAVKNWASVFLKLFGFIVWFSLIVVSMQALLNKLTMISFLVHRDIWHWDIWEYLSFVGFVNQIVGAFDFYEWDLSRVLLFAFGGYNAHMENDECEAVSGYMSLIAMKAATGAAGRPTPHGRLRVVALLCSLTADSLQKMLLSETRERNEAKAMDRRSKLFGNIYPREGHPDSKTAEKEKFCKALNKACWSRRRMMKARKIGDKW